MVLSLCSSLLRTLASSLLAGFAGLTSGYKGRKGYDYLELAHSGAIPILLELPINPADSRMS